MKRGYELEAAVMQLDWDEDRDMLRHGESILDVDGVLEKEEVDE